MKSGLLIVNKEKNMTSRDVVNIACKKLNTRHIGHTGTLDPIATGVLVLGVNEGCRVIDLLTNHSKVYQAEVIVGLETDTLDVTGKVIQSYNIETLEKETVLQALSCYQGKYLQEVPKFSALHLKGKRLYEYARSGEEVELPKREVEIYSLELISDIHTIDSYYTFSIQVHVSKGTYIRSLIRDIGNKLGIPCCMKELVRLRQGNFLLEDSIKIEEVTENSILPIEQALDYPKIIVEDEGKKKIQNGCILELETEADMVLVSDDQHQLLAIYKRYEKDPRKMKPYCVFKGK